MRRWSKNSSHQSVHGDDEEQSARQPDQKRIGAPIAHSRRGLNGRARDAMRCFDLSVEAVEARVGQGIPGLKPHAALPDRGITVSNRILFRGANVTLQVSSMFTPRHVDRERAVARPFTAGIEPCRVEASARAHDEKVHCPEERSSARLFIPPRTRPSGSSPTDREQRSLIRQAGRHVANSLVPFREIKTSLIDATAREVIPISALAREGRASPRCALLLAAAAPVHPA